jgi:hypothetical protein
LPGDPDVRDLFNAVAGKYVEMNTPPHGAPVFQDELAARQAMVSHGLDLGQRVLEAQDKAAAAIEKEARKEPVDKGMRRRGALKALGVIAGAFGLTAMGLGGLVKEAWSGGNPTVDIDPSAYIPDFMELVPGKGYKKLTPEYLAGKGFNEIEPQIKEVFDRMPGKETNVRRFERGNDQVNLFYFRCNDKQRSATMHINGKRTGFADGRNTGFYTKVDVGDAVVELNYEAFGITPLPELSGYKEVDRKTRVSSELGGREITKIKYQNSTHSVTLYQWKDGDVFRFWMNDLKTGENWYFTDGNADGHFEQASKAMYSSHVIDFKKHGV